MSQIIADLEQINMLTWKAPLHGDRNGWQLQLGGGYSRRANSIYTHRYHGDDIKGDIAYCERVYTVHGLPPTFRTTSATQPQQLSEILTQQGYEQSYASHIKTMSLTDQTFITHDNFSYTSQFSMDWLERYMTLNNIDPSLKQSHIAIVQSMPADVCFGSIGTAAMGLAVVLDGYVTFYDIVVDTDERGKGLGRAVMNSLLHWAQQKGATTGALAVDGTNTIANALYEKLGFKTEYDYWYWRKS
jgi:ribosomal protein S18 acetylase RimI-like enzyme